LAAPEPVYDAFTERLTKMNVTMAALHASITQVRAAFVKLNSQSEELAATVAREREEAGTADDAAATLPLSDAAQALKLLRKKVKRIHTAKAGTYASNVAKLAEIVPLIKMMKREKEAWETEHADLFDDEDSD
jgi:autotransporter translocation and assembly factor TamB